MPDARARWRGAPIPPSDTPGAERPAPPEDDTIIGCFTAAEAALEELDPQELDTDAVIGYAQARAQLAIALLLFGCRDAIDALAVQVEHVVTLAEQGKAPAVRPRTRPLLQSDELQDVDVMEPGNP